jgi:hypothetical protein
MEMFALKTRLLQNNGSLPRLELVFIYAIYSVDIQVRENWGASPIEGEILYFYINR